MGRVGIGYRAADVDICRPRRFKIIINIFNYAIKFFIENKLDPKSIDEAMKLGTNHPMGPLEL